MYKSKRVVGILMLAVVFMMIFSSVAMAAPATTSILQPPKPMIHLSTSKVSSLDITKAQAEGTFIIEDNVIIGIAPAMASVRDKIMLPDTIDGVPVDVDYNKLAEYEIELSCTRDRIEKDHIFKLHKKTITVLTIIMVVCLLLIFIAMFITEEVIALLLVLIVSSICFDLFSQYIYNFIFKLLQL